jgi:ATP synthase protein I
MTRAVRSAAVWAPGAAALAGVALTAVAAAVAGPGAAVSALLGTALVVGFLGSGIVPLLLVRGLESSAALGLGVLLLNYTLRLAVAVLVLTLAARSELLDPRWAGFAVIAGALAWAGGQLVAVLRDDPAGSGPSPADR